MIKVVQGNDFLLHITLTEESIDIGSADGVKLRLVGFSNSVEIPCEVLSAHEISSRVEGDLPCGTYGVEITGRLVGNDFRSFEVGQIGIVYTNAEADHAPTDVLSIETINIGMGVGMAIMQIREQSDWAETDTKSYAYIKNKPDLSKKADKDYVDGRVEDVEAFAQELYETKAEKRAVAKLDHALKEPQVIGNVLRFVDATHPGYIDVTLPTTPAQVQSDWEEDDNTKKSYILNKPDVYTKSQVDIKLATKASVSNVYTKAQTDNKLKDKADVSDVEALETAMQGKASIGALSGMMSSPALSTLADGRQEFLANVNSPNTPFRMVIPAPADVNKAYVDRQVAAAKPMVVNTIFDEETGGVKADKPFAEVLAWAKAGGTVVLRESPDEDTATEYPLIYHDASMLQFRVAPESTCVLGFDLYEDDTLEYIEDYSAQENIDMMGERIDALDNNIFQSETTYSLPMEGEERMNPPYTPFGGGPLTKWATLPAGITQREDIAEFSLDDGATWYSQNTSTRAVKVVDGKVYWSVDSSAPTPPPEPSDTLQIKVAGVVEKLQNQIDSLDARVTALENQ